MMASVSPPRKRREALTQARARVEVHAWDASAESAGLARALDVGDVGDEALESYTHRFHSYTARLHPATARRVLELLALPERAQLLDPFCGSGTVLVEGVRAGLSASGLDASPLAVLVARAKTWASSPADRRELVARARAIRDEVVARGRSARRAGQAPPPPRDVDRRRQDSLAGWFDPHVRREVEALRSFIGGDDVLGAVLSSVLTKVSRREADSRAERAPRTIARGFPARLFADRAVELAAGLEELWRDAPRGTPPPDVRLGDARALPAPAGAFDAVLTSPPYFGTYDYAEQHALRLAFLGLPPLKNEIGARSRSGGEEADYGAVLAELGRVSAGPIVLVIGDSLAAGRAVHADQMIRRLAAAAGLEVVGGASARRLALGRAEAEAFARAPKREHVIWLRSASGRRRPPRKNPSS